MPGMISNPGGGSTVLVSAFRSALLHQWMIVALIFVFLLLIWGTSRTAFSGSMSRDSASEGAGVWREPRARRLLRIGFGIIWLFDGLLQAQPQMPGGLADQVIKPTASGSPGWVQHLVNFGVNLWDYHPITAAAASVWIQVGIGLWMLVAVRGWSARLAGLAGVGWGLVVWAFGESFGGIFAPGLSVLFGAPGAVLIYVLAGALIALPERAWDGPRMGRLLLGGTGAFFLGMALLQAWPGRGFWQGKVGGQLGSLTSMIATMSSTSEPRVIHAIVSGFGNFTVSHGFAVNLIAVIALVLIGGGLCAAAVRADARLARIVVIAGAVFCLADWVLIEDMGVFGGLGTDPNSMIPFILLFTAGYLALAPAPAPVLVPAVESAGTTATSVVLSAPLPEASDSSAGDGEQAASGPASAGDTTEMPASAGDTTEMPASAGDTTEMPRAEHIAGVPAQVEEATPAAGGEDGTDGPAPPPAPEQEAETPEPAGAPRRPGRVPELLRAFARAPVGVVAGVGALGVILVGAAPMAAASVNKNADPIVAQSIAGSNGLLNQAAPGFTLTSQDGRQVSLASLRGKVVLLTFLDPVCTTDCPIIAQEMRSADTLLGSKASDTELVAVVANPTYLSTAYTKAFTVQENLSQVPNWLYLTGSLNQLKTIWNQYGVEVEDLPAGAMAAHNDIAFVIGTDGQMQQEISMDPGPATAVTTSSFAGLLANSVLQSMGQS